METKLVRRWSVCQIWTIGSVLQLFSKPFSFLCGSCYYFLMVISCIYMAVSSPLYNFIFVYIRITYYGFIPNPSKVYPSATMTHSGACFMWLRNNSFFFLKLLACFEKNMHSLIFVFIIFIRP